MTKIISDIAIKRRTYWIEEIRKLSGNFGNDTEKLEIELAAEIKENAVSSLIDHLRLCGNIPESYNPSSSEEKLYSKYTDCVLSFTYTTLGLNSLVLKERADAADVEVFAKDYSFVADAKAFRLSRTTVNQKDLKIQSMHSWKRGKLYAMVVCPIYQLPISSSQIYEQATTQNVCIFTYSHLALLLAYSQIEGQAKAQELLKQIFQTVQALNPSKNATDYWVTINKTMLTFSAKIQALWEIEKGVATESIAVAKAEALTFLAQEREKIMRMSHQEALRELLNVYKIESKMNIVTEISDNELFTLK
jgi:hypothetical protein